MKRRLKVLPSLTAFALVMLVVAGCNIFSFTNDEEKPPIQKAEDAIRDGDYAKAREELAGVVKDSTDAQALYLNAKAVLLSSGVDLVKIVELIEGQDNAASGDNLAILQTIDELDDTEKTDWYQANMEVRANLSKIWGDNTFGILKKDDVALDYTVSNMMSGVLGLRDTNRDGIINANDFQINLSFVENVGVSSKDGFKFDGAKVKDDQGNIIEDLQFDGLTVFLGDWAGKITGAAKVAQDFSDYTPDDINELIAFVLTMLEDGNESILLLLSEKDNTSFDVDEIEQYIKEMAVIINYYWYNDGIDNDGDGLIDEEIIDGIDNDGDGLIDEDSNYHPADPTEEKNTQYQQIWQKWNNK